MLFIFSGAFDGLEDMIKKRVKGRNTIGFINNTVTENESEYLKDNFIDVELTKEEYEKLNGEINTNNSKKYPEVKISDDNVIKYSNYEEILEILKDKNHPKRILKFFSGGKFFIINIQ